MNRRFLFGLLTIIMFFLANMLCNLPVVGQADMTLPPTPAKSLAEQAGFSSPILDDLQQKGMRWVNENIPFTAYGHDYRLLSFLPIGVPTNDGNRLDLGAAMLFQLDKNVAKLLWRKDIGGEWTILDAKHAETGSWPAPGNWQKNGQIDFGVLNVADSTCPFHILNMYVLSSDGTVFSAFKNLIPLDHVVTSIEIQKNDSLLLTTVDERGKSMNRCIVPHMIRYFELTGTKLTDVSVQHQETYMNKLGEDIYFTITWKSIPQLDDNTNSEWYAARLMEVLLIYDELGERDAGYNLVQNLATEAIKTSRIKPHTYLDQIFLPTMAQLYQQHQPFIEPAYIGPNPRQQHNYYQ
ncbi:MAG: hypothetical protein ABI947_13735 [Chloroflexota bacterium]